jgi:hypothetical protein
MGGKERSQWAQRAPEEIVEDGPQAEGGSVPAGADVPSSQSAAPAPLDDLSSAQRAEVEAFLDCLTRIARRLASEPAATAPPTAAQGEAAGEETGPS